MGGDVYDVLVIGAGPAGAAAARALSRAGRSVLLAERGTLPRHRLCGSFLSPEAIADLGALGLEVGETGAVPLPAARVAAGSRVVQAGFERPAYGLGRDVLDAWLARAAVASGAVLRLRAPVSRLGGDLQRGFTAEVGGDRVRARAVIAASGKHRAAFRNLGDLDAPAGRGTAASAHRAPAWRVAWVGLGAHLRLGDEMPPRVDLHAFEGGYVGVAPVGAGCVNVCAVVRTPLEHGRAAPAGSSAMVDGSSMHAAGATSALAAIARGVPAVARLWDRAALVSGSVTCESGTGFAAARAVSGDVLLAGDAAAFAHPLGGDGIAMALRAGRMAAATTGAFLAGRLRPEDVASAYARAWRREFAARLRWCALLHGLVVRPVLATPLLRLLGFWPSGLHFLVERTRGRELTLEGIA